MKDCTFNCFSIILWFLLY